MTYEQHMELYWQYNAEAREHLDNMRTLISNNEDWSHEWIAHKTAYKAANKHYGIAQGIMTRRINRIRKGK